MPNRPGPLEKTETEEINMTLIELFILGYVLGLLIAIIATRKFK